MLYLYILSTKQKIKYFRVRSKTLNLAKIFPKFNIATIGSACIFSQQFTELVEVRES